ncbi:hypothetical protein ARMSODRAFT_639232 [Armillaria solidipes]|uniref:Uncharacterized protein n=1 Tax=Armillaria solidipes TaxID=1076256 RepID=A0A2H3C5G8_9AGAR|nr:hypothetical protein ARMSODRAFT_639232 [Armillaria solidipes]
MMVAVLIFLNFPLMANGETGRFSCLSCIARLSQQTDSDVAPTRSGFELYSRGNNPVVYGSATYIFPCVLKRLLREEYEWFSRPIHALHGPASGPISRSSLPTVSSRFSSIAFLLVLYSCDPALRQLV